LQAKERRNKIFMKKRHIAGITGEEEDYQYQNYPSNYCIFWRSLYGILRASSVEIFGDLN
jgi:hypothetical protein